MCSSKLPRRRLERERFAPMPSRGKRCSAPRSSWPPCCLGIGQSFAALEKQQVIICAHPGAGDDRRHADGAARFRGRDRRLVAIRPSAGGHPAVGARRRPRALVADSRHDLRLRRRIGDDLHCVRQFRRHCTAGDSAAIPEIDAIRRRAAAGSPRDYLPNDPCAGRSTAATAAAAAAATSASARWCSGSSARRSWSPARPCCGPAWPAASSARSSTAGACSPTRATSGGASIRAWSGCTTSAWSRPCGARVQSYPEIYARVTHDFCTAIWPIAAFSLHRLSARHRGLRVRRGHAAGVDRRELRDTHRRRRLPGHECRRGAGDARCPVPRPPTPAALSHAPVAVRRRRALRRDPRGRQLHQRLGIITANRSVVADSIKSDRSASRRAAACLCRRGRSRSGRGHIRRASADPARLRLSSGPRRTAS